MISAQVEVSANAGPNLPAFALPDSLAILASDVLSSFCMPGSVPESTRHTHHEMECFFANPLASWRNTTIVVGSNSETGGFAAAAPSRILCPFLARR
jgi:hypothetical protein